MTENLSLFPGLEAPEYKTCKDCEHPVKLELNYWTNTAYYYCRATSSKRTNSKLMKIKLKNKACGKFKQKSKGDNK